MSEIYKKGSIYFPNLDSLRFLAFFVVFINHVVATLGHKTSNTTITYIKSNFLLNGDLGVNFFFVLSGFLITFLLIKEKQNDGKIKIGFFYLRRIFRIWPVYYMVLFLGLVIVPIFSIAVIKGFPVITYTHVLNKSFYLFFLGNFDYVFNGISNAVIGILWSVSVEEQFYLFWPLIIAIVPRKYLNILFVALIAFSISFRYYGTTGRSLNLMQLYHTFSSLSDLATGALIAYFTTSQKFLDFFKKMNPFLIGFVYLIGIGLIMARKDILGFDITHNDYLKQIQYRGKAPYPRPNQIWHSIMPVVYSAFFGFVLMTQIFSDRFPLKAGKIKIFTSLGKISYGLYSFHMVAMFFVVYVFMKMGINITRPDKITILLESVTALALTIVISKLSYRFMESKFLNIKNRLTAEKVISKRDQKKLDKKKKKK